MKLSLAQLEACLLAGAAGDCIGGPHEGMVPSGPVEPPTAPWRVSDDTVLSLATARAVLETHAVEPAAIASEFLRDFRANRIPGIGASTLKAMRDLDAGQHWALAGARGERAAGNGAAMRIAPLAFFLDADDPEEGRTIRDVCRITHHNDEAYVGALAVVRAMQLQSEASTSEKMTVIASRLPDSGRLRRRYRQRGVDRWPYLWCSRP